MSPRESDTISAAEKIDIYDTACLLFQQGLSYPQVLENLNTLTEELDLPVTGEELGLLTTRAMQEDWDKLREQIRTGIAAGKPYYALKEAGYESEPDREVVDYLVDAFYALKTAEIDAESEGREMQQESKWGMLKYGAGAALLFFFSSNIYLKELWVLIFIGCLLSWIYSFVQRRKARVINQFFTHESDTESL